MSVNAIETRAKLHLKIQRNKLTDKMTESTSANSDVAHRCAWPCLGPLTFHSQVIGSKVSLSHGNRCAERMKQTFKNGIVFSNRKVKVNERISLRVEKELSNWHGGLRLGFTNVRPSSMALPLPYLAVPNLTSTPGYWAAPVPENLYRQGSELEFWVSSGGTIYVEGLKNNICKIESGVDLSKPLWAMIDIYGNTHCICLLGSKKVTLKVKRTSCPAPELPTSPVDNTQNWSDSDMRRNKEIMACLEMEVKTRGEGCVVCLAESAGVTLPCGHRCLCTHCSPRVIMEFGRCPLCRHSIVPPKEKGKH